MKSLLVTAAVLGLAAAAATAAPVVDQSNLPSGPGSFGGIDNSVPIRAQSFTVGLDGFLTGVRLNLSDKGNFDNSLDAELTVGIFDVVADSIDIAGGAKASETVGRVLGSGSFDDTELLEVTFGASVPVSVGDTLAIVLSGVDAGQNDGFWWKQSGSYDGGVAFRTFHGNLEPFASTDYHFETLVDSAPVDPIPVPASLPLLLAGLGAVGLLRRRGGA